VTVLRRLLCAVGRRGAALLFFALLDFVYSYSLFNPAPELRNNPNMVFLRDLLPLSVWATLWAIVGVLCLRDAFRQNDKVGFAAAIAMKVMWGLVSVVGVFYGVPRAYVSATIWLCLAGWVAIISTWPEPPPMKLLLHRSAKPKE
jgi:hypothetical protein